MDNSSSPLPPSGPKSSGFRGNLPIIAALTLAGLGFIAVIVFAVLIFCSGGRCGGALAGGGGGDPLPTPFPVGTVAAAPDSIVSVQLDSGEAISLTVDAPNLLTIAGQNYAVQRGAAAADGRWTPTVATATTAVWLNGTVINYVFALQDTTEVRGLMESLERGDEIVLTTKTGQTRRFSFNSREIVPVTQQDVYAQNTPAVTLLLVGLGDRSTDRMIVRGRFITDEAAQSIPPGGSGAAETNVVTLGEVAQLGDLQIAVTAFDNRPIAGSSFAYYLVDYQIQNNGALPFDTTQLVLQLVDNVGNLYNLSLDASRLGNNPPLAPALAPGQLVQATAGYQIPSGLGADALGWIVRRGDTGAQVEVRTAPQPTDGDAAVAGVSVQLLNAALSPDAASLVLTGQISNQGTSVAVIEQTDVQMSSDGTVFFILSTNPAFPWVVGPGQTIPYALTVQRPLTADQAVFSILGQSFELSNYR